VILQKKTCKYLNISKISKCFKKNNIEKFQVPSFEIPNLKAQGFEIPNLKAQVLKFLI
jgi:hypothetical protein